MKEDKMQNKENNMEDKIDKEVQEFFDMIDSVSKESRPLNCFPDPAETCYNKSDL